MFNSNLPEPDVLNAVLKPLLDDFQYWFERSRILLENESIAFLPPEEQNALLIQVRQAQQEVATTQTLLRLTEGQVGIETAVLMKWHRLVTQCWQVTIRFRLDPSAQKSSSD